MTDRATLAGTKQFAENWRGRAADEHFREVNGLVVSSLGIGTYLGQPDDRTDAAYAEAIAAAVENGINLMDRRLRRSYRRSGGKRYQPHRRCYQLSLPAQ